MYGLLIGLAVVVGWQIALSVLRREKISLKQQTKLLFALGIGALLGARIWHLATDWHLYTAQPVMAVYIWNGGLSILGALLGGGLGVVVMQQLRVISRDQLKQLFDVLALALPITQALGRVANWINQELYGLPTDLPWALHILPPNRVAGYESFATFHPLFAYESLGLLGLAGFLWWLYQTQKVRVGAGVFAGLYILGYAGLRFCLELIRVDKSMFLDTGWGVNQIILALVFIFGVSVILRSWSNQHRRWLLWLLGGLMVVLGVVSWLVRQVPEPSTLQSGATQTSDQKLLRIYVGDVPLTVELVTTSAKIARGLSGRSEIGADGMLFVFAQPIRPGFWMKEMQFDLDLVWIQDGKIVDITPNVPAPPPNTPVQQLEVYYPAEPVTMVLEVPAGFAAQQRWQIGTPLALDTPAI